MSSPVALPSDFARRWASDSPSDEIFNPFSDGSQSSSRVTASGFTNTTVNQKKVKLPSVILEMSEDSSDGYSSITEGPMLEKKKLKEKYMKAKEIQDPIKREKERTKYSEKMKEFDRNFDYGFDKKQNEEAKWEMDKRDRYVTLDDFKQFTERIEASIHPKDSASVYDPAPSKQKRIMSLPIRESGNSVSIVGGYMQTVEQKIEELESYTSTTPISGLPIIFTNDRLNFLCHLHAPLFKLLSDDDGKYPANDSMSRLLDNNMNWNVDPATMLLGQVLDKTIDFRKATVKSNPFNLPIIEPTMILSERIVFMCFDQLHKEFEREWFNTFKTVTTPTFSSKYESRKFKSRKYSSSSSGVVSTDSHGSRENSGGSSRRSSRGSVVSRNSFLGF